MFITILGFGSIGRGIVPLLLKNGISPRFIHVFDKSDEHAALADELGVAFTQLCITRDNYQDFVRKYCGVGDMLLNLAVSVSSAALLKETLATGTHYLDTCVEPWDYNDYSPHTPISNALLRSEILREAHCLEDDHGYDATSVIAHGANPGLITYFVKQGLVYLRDKFGPQISTQESDRTYWADLASALGVRVVQIAEHDTQTDDVPFKSGEFHNTWSVHGFLSELHQTAELGAGVHERDIFKLTDRISHFAGARAVLLNRPNRVPGYAQKVKTWTPSSGSAEGWLVTHHEALSVNALLTREEHYEKGETSIYAPTVYYAYQPCPKAQQSIQEMHADPKPVHMKPTAGYDQLGALLMYEGQYGSGGVWCGSTLSVEQCGIPHNPPTTMQVTASIWAAILYMMRNPDRGVLEAEDLPWGEMLREISPYLGTISTVETDWTPGSGLQLQSFLVN